MAKADAKILIIDDEKPIGEFFKDLFGMFDTQIDVANSGKKGLSLVAKQKYSLVFLDYKLGDLTGLEVLEEIKKTDKKTRVVTISAHLTDDVLKSLKSAGVDGYLYKPMSAEKILGFARKFVDKKTFKA